MQRFAHERHPWLIVLPAAAVLFTLVADFAYVFTGDEAWWLSARPVLAVGLAGLVVAIGAELLDLRTEPAGPTRSVASAYLALDLTVLIALATQTWLRWTMPVPSDGTPGIAWSVICGLLLAGSGWLGWTLVQLHQEPTGRA